MNRQRYQFSTTDRIYARIMSNGRQLAEYMLDGIESMTDLLCELRHLARKFKGLVNLYVRNMSRGWSMQHPLMLCTGRFATTDLFDLGSEDKPAEGPVRTMLMPWEVNM